MKRIYKRLTKNIGAKSLCLIAALFLWLYVASGQNTIAKFPGDIPVKAVNIGADLMAVFDTKTIQVKIMAEPGAWQKLSANSFYAYLDLAGYKEGTYDIPLNVTSTVSGVSIVAKYPDRILVSIEKVAEKEVKISKKIEGSAADGMTAGTISFNPNTVRIRGPQSLVENIDEVVGAVILGGEDKDFKRTISLSLPEPYTNNSADIIISPDQTEAVVTVVKGSNIRTVGIKPRIVGVPKDDNYPASVSITPSVVDISGTRNTLIDLKYLETADIDVTNLSGVITKAVLLDLPEGVSLIDPALEKVMVTITLSPYEPSRNFDVTKFYYNNIDSGKIAGTPQAVRVAVSGSRATLDNLSPDDFLVTLNFQGKMPNSANEISFDLTESDIRLPLGTTLISIYPQKISVKLR